MLFKFNHLTYEVPEKAGVSVKVEVGAEHADYNFVDEHGEDIPKLGGTDEQGRPVKSWDDYGIRLVGDDRAVADAQS